MNFVLKGVVAVSLLRVVNSNERRHGILMTEKKGTKWLVFAAFWVGGSNATYPESVWDYVIYSLWHWSLNYPHIYHENDSFSCNMNRKMRGKLIRGLRASYSAACISSLRTYIPLLFDILQMSLLIGCSSSFMFWVLRTNTHLAFVLVRASKSLIIQRAAK